MPVMEETREGLARFGYLPRGTAYALETEQGLEKMANIAVALAEACYQSIARDIQRGKGEVDPPRTELTRR